MKVKYLGEECEIKLRRYGGGGIRIDLLEECGLVFATATEPVEGLKKDEVAIANYELEGILDVLIDAGVIEETHRVILSGFVHFPVCRLKIAY